MTWQLIDDVYTASPRAKKDAVREIMVTLAISLSAFFIGPLLFAIIALPGKTAATGLLSAFSGADIYIASISLLSISIYSISKEYNIEGRDYFGFPHATSVLIIAFIITMIGFVVYTSRTIYQAAPTIFEWRAIIASIVGWATFIFATWFAYAVLVLRNDLEFGASHRTQEQQDNFADEFAASRREG